MEGMLELEDLQFIAWHLFMFADSSESQKGRWLGRTCRAASAAPCLHACLRAFLTGSCLPLMLFISPHYQTFTCLHCLYSYGIVSDAVCLIEAGRT